MQEWLAVKSVGTAPGGEEMLLSQMDQIAIRMIKKAIDGDVNAAILVMDSAFGKIANVNITEKEKPDFDISKLSDDELQQIEEAGKLFNKCITKTNDGYEDAQVVE